MPKIKFFFIVTIFLLSFSVFANGQAMMSYLYLEVVDSKQKPVEAAKIEYPSLNKKETAIKETDVKGSATFGFMQPGPSFRLSEFTIKKPDYYPFDLFKLLRDSFNNGQNWYSHASFTIELLKIPKDKDEEKLLGDEQIKRDFFSAVLKGDSAEVRRLLNSGINPNISTDDLRGVPAPKGIPAMLYAADSLDIATINEFLSANVNLRNENSNVRNILAYYIGNLNTHVSSKEQLTIFNAYFETLLKAGASLNATDARGQTLLTIAAKQNNLEIVKSLIEKGVDVNAKNKDESTALTELVNFETHSKHDPQRVEIFELLLKSGANPNIFREGDNGECYFPLKTLTYYGRLNLAKLFLSYKADPIMKCKNGNNALSDMSLDPNYPEVVNILIDAGSDVNAGNYYTPLMTAVIFGNIPIVKKLLSKGAKINAQNGDGLTALMLSLLTDGKPRNIQLVKLLLQSGANPNLITKNSYRTSGTALAIVICDETPSYFPDKEQASDDIIKLLIDYKADVNLVFKDKDAPLTCAARGGRIEALKMLIKAGANLNAKNSYGQTALSAAKNYQHSNVNQAYYQEIIKILLEAGAKE